MLLSACLIVKNEELTLRRCLESLQGVVDEIVLVDTGSTDRTLDIAREYTSKIYHYDWDNHFAHARNESLKHAQGEFILVIDADEYLDDIKRHSLREQLTHIEADGFLVNILNYVGENGKIFSTRPVSVVRLFRNGYFYDGSVHEQIAEAIMKAGKQISKINLDIHHVGYLNEIVTYKNKSSRNILLLKEELEKDPQNLFHLSNLLAEYIRLSNFHQALKIVKKSLDIIRKKPPSSWDHITARIFVFHITTLVGLQKNIEAEEIASKYIMVYPELAEFRTRYGMILAENGKFKEAIEQFNFARKLGDPKEALFDLVQGMGSFLAALMLGRCWIALGDKDTALQYYFTSFLENPNQDILIFPLVYLLPYEKNFFEQEIEPRITDPVALASYCEAYFYKSPDDIYQLIQRIESKIAQATVLERVKLAVLYKQDPKKALEIINTGLQNPYLISLSILIKINNRCLQINDIPDFPDDRIQTLKNVLLCEYSSTPISPFLRDILLFNCHDLLSEWLPKAPDRYEAYLYLMHLPELPCDFNWSGETAWECEMLALRAFKNKNLDVADIWLAKAANHSLTITRLLLECDVALAKERTIFAQSCLQIGLKEFPESQLLKNVAIQLGISSMSQYDEKYQLECVSEMVEMRASDIYLKNSVHTMPFHMQLSALHERAANLVKYIYSCYKQEKILELRKAIEEIQNIITFIRGSLDLSLEASQAADKVYAFYYKMSVEWFIQPQNIEQNYEEMENFWRSWAETWKKV